MTADRDTAPGGTHNAAAEASGLHVASSQVAYDGQLSRVRIDVLTDAAGRRFEREVVEHLDAVAVVPVTAAGEVVLVRQYRHPFGERQLEIPAGLRDLDGEDPAAAAARELAEETGYAAAELDELVVMRNSAGWTDEATTIYLATGVAPAPSPEGFEAEAEEATMEVVVIGLDDAVARVAAGALPDSKTALGLLLAARRLG